MEGIAKTLIPTGEEAGAGSTALKHTTNFAEIAPSGSMSRDELSTDMYVYTVYLGEDMIPLNPYFDNVSISFYFNLYSYVYLILTQA